MSTVAALDTNLLLLYIAGIHSKSSISKIKRLRPYSATDFDLLTHCLGRFRELVLTPNTVTEVSNLLRAGQQTPEHPSITTELKKLLHRFGERYVRSADAFALPEAAQLGVTDAVMLTIANTGALLVTADLDLWLAANRRGHLVINFNHYRDSRRYQ